MTDDFVLDDSKVIEEYESDLGLRVFTLIDVALAVEELKKSIIGHVEGSVEIYMINQIDRVFPFTKEKK